MGLASALGKLRRTRALAADAPTRRALLWLFAVRYRYPGTGLVRWFGRGFYARPRVTLSLRDAHPMKLTLRPSDVGDVASFFETFVETPAEFFGPGSPRLAVDAGAHIGCFSVRLHDLHPAMPIVAFEPAAANLELLRENYSQNGIPGEIRPVALWKESGTLRFATGQSNEGHLAEGSDAGVDVPVESLRDALGDRLAKADFVKIDIEGAERDVLPGMLAALPSGARAYVEVHDVARHGADMDRAVSAAGWTRSLGAFYPPHECWMLANDGGAR